MLVKTFQFVTIILVALLVGLAFAHVLEHPAKMQYDAQFYITIQKTLYVFWGPPNVGGILEPAAILTTVALCLIVRKDRKSFWLALAAVIMLLIAFPVIFYIFVEPSNASFRAATPSSIPQIGSCSVNDGKRVIVSDSRFNSLLFHVSCFLL
jgi:hypothetical protein